MLKSLLLWVWYGLPGRTLAEACDNAASFRRFSRFAAVEPAPEGTAFVWFRKEPVRHGPDTVLFEALTCQFDEKNVMLKMSMLVETTNIASTSITKDEEARWVGRRRKAACMATRRMWRPTPSAASSGASR